MFNLNIFVTPTAQCRIYTFFLSFHGLSYFWMLLHVRDKLQVISTTSELSRRKWVGIWEGHNNINVERLDILLVWICSCFNRTCQRRNRQNSIYSLYETPVVMDRLSNGRQTASHVKPKVKNSPLTCIGPTACTYSIDSGGHGGWWVQWEVPVFAALLLLLPTSQPRIPRAVPAVETVVRPVALVVGVEVRRLAVVRGRHALKGVSGSSGGCPLLQVVEPEGKVPPVLEGGCGVDEGIGQKLPAFL